MIDYWPVELVDGTKIAVEPRLTSISTYALVEQEDWFEKEIAFVRRFLQPGMVALDIGANIGIYTQVMARIVGPTGRVHAVEPQRGPRMRIEEGLRMNGLANVTIWPVALSAVAGRGAMRGEDSEVARAWPRS